MLRATAEFPIVTAVVSARLAARSIPMPTHHGSSSYEPILEPHELVSAGASPRAGAALASTAFQLGGLGA